MNNRTVFDCLSQELMQSMRQKQLRENEKIYFMNKYTYK